MFIILIIVFENYLYYFNYNFLQQEMSDLIDIYQDNIKMIFTRIGKLLENLNNNSTEKAENSLMEAENSLKEAERIVRINIISKKIFCFLKVYSLFKSIS